MTLDRDGLAVTRNLRNAKKRISDATEIASFHIDELAYYLAEGGDMLGERFFEIYSEVRQALIAPVNGETDGAALEAARACLLGRLCERVLCESERLGRAVSASDLLSGVTEAENGKIAYMRNALSDEAYRAFADTVENASVVYPSSFSAVCEEVYYGRVGYCILPYESSEEGTLSGFMRLIAKHELCPVRTCSVRTDHGVTRFALLGRAQYGSALSGKGRRILKLTVDRPEPYTFLRLLSASGELGLTLRKTESAPVAWSEGYATTLTLEIGERDVKAFLLYLALEVPECAYKAVYTELS